MRSCLLLFPFLIISIIKTNNALEVSKETAVENSNNNNNDNKNLSAQVEVIFSPNKLKLTMDNSSRVDFKIIVDKTALSQKQLDPTTAIVVELKPLTLSPQLDIIEFDNIDTKPKHTIKLSLDQLNKADYQYNSTLYLKATYIGHATIEVKAYIKKTNESLGEPLRVSEPSVEFTIIRNEGILDKIFMYSVVVFITISYINLGAQIDIDNVRKLVETPRIIILGLLIGFSVMPAASWVAGHIFFRDQPMYRLGSFIYASAPAASASVLWTVMFDADKELALGLQIASTVGALIMMPIFLYAMDKSIDLEGQYTIKVPYMNLFRTLVVLLIALVIGMRLVGRGKKAKKISQRVFRPLTMFVLLFIIVFSSIVYWYIYRMFNWTITLMALCVTTATYVISGFLGYLIHRDIDHMFTISISSTYRNSGIAFAALVVAFQPPDIFIAYVPCLTQVVTTSLIGLVLYCIKSLKDYLARSSYS